MKKPKKYKLIGEFERGNMLGFALAYIWPEKYMDKEWQIGIYLFVWSISFGIKKI